MHKLLFLIAVCLIVKTVYSEKSLYPPIPKPEKYANQPGCYHEELDIVIPANGTYSPKEKQYCAAYICKGDNQWMEELLCCSISAPGCDLKEDLTLPYPDCCPKPTNCKKDAA